MEQVLSPKDFVPRESVKKREYWMDFPFSHCTIGATLISNALHLLYNRAIEI